MIDEWIRQLFDYDPQAPLEFQQDSVVVQDQLTISEISYASPKGGRVPAYIVAPIGPGPFAAIILMHGAPGDRDVMLPHAKDLARTGAVSCCISAPFARPENKRGGPITIEPEDRDEQIQLIIDLRRAIDLLSTRRDIDISRLAYLGRSYGAAMGGLLAGIEQRIKAYVLMIGNGGLISLLKGKPEHYPLHVLPEGQWERWLKVMEPIEPIHFVKYAAPAALFFQASWYDDIIPQHDASAFYETASEPKQMRWYFFSGHRLPREAYDDQVAWLAPHIGIDASKFIRSAS